MRCIVDQCARVMGGPSGWAGWAVAHPEFWKNSLYMLFTNETNLSVGCNNIELPNFSDAIFSYAIFHDVEFYLCF